MNDYIEKILKSELQQRLDLHKNFDVYKFSSMIYFCNKTKRLEKIINNINNISWSEIDDFNQNIMSSDSFYII